MKNSQRKTPGSALPWQTASLALAVAFAQQSFAQQGEGYLEEVVVTAQRREERSLDVPISITSIGGEMLGKGDIQQLADISKLTPGLRFDYAGGTAQPTIRGVGSALIVSGGGSNVGIYTDGFYSPNPYFSDTDLLNVQSIQVLKGPQGTLFGRNSTGGAILVSTGEPESEPAAEVEASYGSYNAQRYGLYATGGPSETVAFDAAVLVRKGDGYVENIYLDDDEAGSYDNWSLRLGGKVEISDSTSVIARYTHAEGEDRRNVAANSYEENGQVFSFVNTVYGPSFVATKPDEVAFSSAFQPEFQSEADIFQLTVKHELDKATLTSYTQLRRERTTNIMDFDFSAAPVFHFIYDANDDIFTQEFLLSAEASDRLQWTTGLFFFANENEYANNRGDAFNQGFVLNGGSGTDTRSVAGFGDMTYQLQDNWFLTAGLRISYDETTDAYLTNSDTLQQIPVDDISDTKVTPRVVLRYTPTEESSVYLSYTQGHKSGVLNVGGQTLENIEIDPEEIQAFELGYKYAGDNFTFDAAAYYYDYQDLQVASYDGAKSLIENAGDSSITGVEAQARFALSENLSFNLGGNFMNAEYENFDRSQRWDQCLSLQFCGPFYGFVLPSYVDAGGNTMQRSPEFTGNLGLTYSTELAGGTLDLTSTLYYTSEFYFDSSEQFEQEGYELLSLRAEWTDPSDRYTLALFGDNLTDSEYRTQVLPQFYGPLSMWGQPATFGASANVRF